MRELLGKVAPFFGKIVLKLRIAKKNTRKIWKFKFFFRTLPPAEDKGQRWGATSERRQQRQQ